ncbi:MAG: DUF1778 domain-containing protein [Pyrinomonadaceae bacterium]
MVAVLQRMDEAATKKEVVVRYSSAATPATVTVDKNASTRGYEQTINRHIRLTRRDSEVFLALLDSDEEPNNALKQAAEEYKRKHR